MAQPFFNTNYRVASTAPAAAIIAQTGQTQGQMLSDMGKQIGGMIEQYGLNKEKRNNLQATLEGQLSADPSIVQQLTMTGDEEYDKKNMKLFDKVQSGDASIADLERANGLLAGKTTQENAMLKKRIDELNVSVQEALKDPTIKKAIAEANIANDQSMYTKSIASADYAGKIQDNALKSAQTEYQKLKTDLLKTQNTYKEGDIIEKEGVKFFYTGETFQPLNDSISKKTIQEAVIKGLDQAAVQTYLDDNYNYDEESQTYTFDKSEYFGGKRNPMMEEAITILGLRGKIKPSKDDTSTQEEVESSMPKEELTITTQEEFDALPSGAIYLGSDGKKRRKP